MTKRKNDDEQCIYNAKATEALYDAIRINDLNGIETAITQGANLNDISIFYTSPLCHAIQSMSSLATIKILIQYGANINEQDEICKFTPLHRAIMLSHTPDTIKTLILLGADVTLRDWRDQTPKETALNNERADIVEAIENAQRCAELEREWIMESSEFGYYFQWLPREVSEDIQDLVFPHVVESTLNTETQQITKKAKI